MLEASLRLTRPTVSSIGRLVCYVRLPKTLPPRPASPCRSLAGPFFGSYFVRSRASRSSASGKEQLRVAHSIT